MEYFLVVIKRDENVFLSVFSLWRGVRGVKRGTIYSHGCTRTVENKELAPMAAKKVFTVEDNTLITGNSFLLLFNELNFHNLLLS